MLKSDWKDALILGGTTTGLGFARSLGKKGVTVTVAAASAAHPGMHSKWGTPLLVPNPVSQPEQCFDQLMKWGRIKKERSVLIPTLEEYVQILSDHRHDLEEFFQFLIPPASLVDPLLDKKTQYQLMESFGLDIPLAVYSDEENFIAEVSEKIGFPCLFKPCRSYIWRQVPGRFKAKVVASKEELTSLCKEFYSRELTFLVQEIIPGGDDCLHTYLGCYSAAGRSIAELTVKKIRQHPQLYGTGSLILSSDNPEISHLSRDVLERIGYSGHVDMEYKQDSRDQSWKLIELNIRSASFVQLAIASGLDLPWIGYLEACHRRHISRPSHESGVLFMHMSWDLQSVLASSNNRFSAFLSWLLLIRKVRAFAVFNLRDIKPIIWEVSDYCRKLPRWLCGRNKKNGQS